MILFLPGDHFLSAALECNPGLIEQAIAQKVALATPATLISALTGVSYGWRQERFAENAEEIRRTAADIVDRLQIWHNHYAESGINLEKAVHAYNKSIASWESRVLPSLRKIRDLGAGATEEPAAVPQIQLAPRSPKAVGADNAA